MWGAAHHLLYLPFVIAAILLLVYRFVRLKKVIALLAGSLRSGVVLRHVSLGRSMLKTILWGLGLTSLFFALLRPQWNKKEEIVMQQGRDLFVALDVSRSMLAQDCVPSRLEFAKQKIKKLLKHLSSERVGLILFSGSSFVQCPLTTDESSFLMFLNQVDVETISSGTTAIDQAIAKALQAFDMQANRKNKLFILFTDGEDFSSNLAKIKKRATKAGLHIFTVGVGSAEGAPIPLFDERGNQVGHQKDKKGSVVISRMNEGILRGLATDSGGTFIHPREDDADIHELVTQIEAFEKEDLEEKKFAKLEEQYQYPLLASFIFFALEWML